MSAAGTATLLLARHGRTAYNQAGLIQGSSPVPLDETGLEQARRLAAHIAALEHPPTRIWSSDLLRAEQTAAAVAEALAKTLRLTVQTDARLREQNFGEYEGRSLKEVLGSDPEFKRAWTGDPALLHPPGGESFAQVTGRLLDWFAEARPRQPGEVILAVSHGLALTALLCALTRTPPREAWTDRLFQHVNASSTELRLDPTSGQVLAYGEVQSGYLNG
ncbi:histidine phosphatase family protein [Deinococcus sp.]|uniref:histidine phosphatase family protein n=1 Tax=Deinococcus sp. TaxID=47478 RepID=UPI0025E642D4|nr:histidine phosphatase family protein [Deinococcus sp.]